MSADNGVYILITRTPNSFRCYRVADFTNVEDLWNDDDTLNREEADLRYGNARVYTNSVDAWNMARELYRELPICEYGVQEIEFDEVY